MIRELLAHNDYVRVLNALERRPMRFGRLQDELKLHPPQVTRALKFLCETKLVASELADTATGLPLSVYALTDRGAEDSPRHRCSRRSAEVVDLRTRPNVSLKGSAGTCGFVFCCWP